MSKPDGYTRIVGHVQKAHGIKGEVKIAISADSGGSMLDIDAVCIDPPGGVAFVASLQNVRQIPHKELYICQLEGVTDRTHAESLRGSTVSVRQVEMDPLPEGTFYMDDILGLEVITDTGRSLGKIIEIIETGANDVYVTDQDVLIPAIVEVVEEIDFEQEIMRIRPLEGMLE
ncbi:MAG: ribosome maturation factor RimM [Armatimonadota bacterium]